MKPLILITISLLAFGQASAQQPNSCPPAKGVALQVLGSGGPIADDGRASTSYIVWVDGKSRALIDAGGGSFLRFGEAGGNFNDLEFIGLSHFHADHSADFVALLKSGNFANRERPLTVAGPSGADLFPGMYQFLHGNLNSETGTFKYLAGYLDGSRGLPLLQPIEITKEHDSATDLLTDNDDLVIYSQHVPHGIVPALGFRVEARDTSLVFASDQNGSDPAFAKFANKASLLVMHMPIPENAGDAARSLHAIPSRIGEVADAAGAQRLLLSHFMARSLAQFDDNVAFVRGKFDGDVLVAQDLYCLWFG
jgi:ribonuclease BN (tRNA processing enzyme)